MGLKSRGQIIKCIIDSTLYINKGQYNNLIKSQKISQEPNDIFDETKFNEKALFKSLENTKENITFDSILELYFFSMAIILLFLQLLSQEKKLMNSKDFMI